MKKNLSKYIDKLFFKKWIIGTCQVNIKDLIRSKKFEADINWLLKKSFNKFYADPFPLVSNGKNFKILYEEFDFEEDYGKISLMTIDKDFCLINSKVLLDTKSHLSYPFFFTENNKTYVFPEAAQSGKLSCYEYYPTDESLVFIKDILNIPLRDSTILNYNGKYWIFGALLENFQNYKLSVFYSNNLLGPYKPHDCNGAYKGSDGIRPAGNFIEVDGVIYRPTQNCKNNYGESITINKVTELNEMNYNEEPYLTIDINKKNKLNRGVHSIHTINSMDNFIVVDGEYWTFAPILQFKKILKKCSEIISLKNKKNNIQ
jgi:hypothetical protein